MKWSMAQMVGEELDQRPNVAKQYWGLWGMIIIHELRKPGIFSVFDACFTGIVFFVEEILKWPWPCSVTACWQT